jgi:hypothetical protein
MQIMKIGFWRRKTLQGRRQRREGDVGRVEVEGVDVVVVPGGSRGGWMSGRVEGPGHSGVGDGESRKSMDSPVYKTYEEKIFPLRTTGNQDKKKKIKREGKKEG